MSIKIYGVVEGPHTRPDMEDGEYVMVVTATVDGQMYYDYEIYSEDFNYLYNTQNHCISSTEPYIVV